MDDGHDSVSSSSFTNYQSHKDKNVHENQMTKFLYQEGEDFFWRGDLNDLKQFVETSLNLHGKWSSPGGDVKQYTGEEFVLKWYGVTKRKIVLVKDSEENALKSMLQNFVFENLNSEDDDFEGNMASQTCLFCLQKIRKYPWVIKLLI